MSKPEDIPQDVWDKAKEIVFTPYLMEWEGIAAVSYAIMAATAAERKRWAAAATYFDRYCQDEADDVENCVCGRQQHEDAQAFAAIRDRSKPLPKPTDPQ